MSLRKVVEVDLAVSPRRMLLDLCFALHLELSKLSKPGLDSELTLAADWGHPATLPNHYPERNPFFQSLVTRMPYAKSLEFVRRLNLMIDYWTEASKVDLSDIPLQLQQFYIDWESGTLVMANPLTRSHEAAIMKQIESGTWSLTPEGSASLGGTRRDLETEAFLRARHAKARLNRPS